MKQDSTSLCLHLVPVAIAICVVGTVEGVFAQARGPDCLTFHCDAQRTGWQPNELVLTPDNVSGGTFGHLWDSPQFDQVAGGAPHTYASLLYSDRVVMSAGPYAGATFGVLFAATSNGFVYAVNAFTTAVGPTQVPAGAFLWSAMLGIPATSNNYDSVALGILSTPMIDNNATPPRLYVACADSAAGWRVFALDVTNGNTVAGWPVVINNTALAAPNQNGPTVFESMSAMSQRGALNLSPDGKYLYVPFGGYADGAAGWLVAIDTQGPSITSAFAGAPSNAAIANAGIWAASGVAIDNTGNVYATTGNGATANETTPGYWGNSLLGWNPGVPLSLLGTYTPFNYCQMDLGDVDLGGGGPVVLPDLSYTGTGTPRLVAFGGKQGNVYLVNRDHLPGSLSVRQGCGADASLDQSLLPPGNQPQFGTRGPLNVFGPYSENYNNADYAKARSTPAFWPGPDGTPYLFVTGSNRGSIGSTTAFPPGIYRLKIVTPPGQPAYLQVDGYDNTLAFLTPGSPVITSNGSASAIVWILVANVPRLKALNTPSQPFVVALDALTFKILWQSSPGDLLVGGKYNTPIVARGVLFVGTDRVQAFGLNAPPAIQSFTATPSAITSGQSSTLAWTVVRAASVSLDQGIGGVSGNSVAVNPSAPTIYTLTASNATGQATKTVTVAVTPPALISINSCGPAVGSFVADTDVSGGHCDTIAAMPNLSGVANAAPAAVYQTKRTGSGKGTSMAYTIPVSVGQKYTVRLHFADDQPIGPGQRVFNVSVNGTVVLPNFDIRAATGQSFKAVVKDIPNIASDNSGQIVVLLTYGSAGNPLISGIEVIPQPPTAPTIASFTATPSSVPSGQPSALGWNVTAATSVSISNIGAVAQLASGSTTVTPTTNTTYTLTATNSVGTVSATATVTVTTPLPPAIQSFTATPSAITSGQSSTLAWTIAGATSVSLDQGIGGVSGNSVAVNPSATTTYTLTGSNAGGPATKTVTVTVTPPISINSCGPAVGSFVADTDVSGGHCDTIAAAPNLSGVANAAPAAVYQTKRTGNGKGTNMTYTIPVGVGQKYTIRLHFADDSSTGPGQRVFNVSVNGTVVLPNFDIRATAGQSFKAVVKDIPNIASDNSGRIVVLLTYGSAGNPLISGIGVIPQ